MSDPLNQVPQEQGLPTELADEGQLTPEQMVEIAQLMQTQGQDIRPGSQDAHNLQQMLQSAGPGAQLAAGSMPGAPGMPGGPPVPGHLAQQQPPAPSGDQSTAARMAAGTDQEDEVPKTTAVKGHPLGFLAKMIGLGAVCMLLSPVVTFLGPPLISGVVQAVVWAVNGIGHLAGIGSSGILSGLTEVLKGAEGWQAIGNAATYLASSVANPAFYIGYGFLAVSALLMAPGVDWSKLNPWGLFSRNKGKSAQPDSPQPAPEPAPQQAVTRDDNAADLLDGSVMNYQLEIDLTDPHTVDEIRSIGDYALAQIGLVLTELESEDGTTKTVLRMIDPEHGAVSFNQALLQEAEESQQAINARQVYHALVADNEEKSDIRQALVDGVEQKDIQKALFFSYKDFFVELAKKIDYRTFPAWQGRRPSNKTLNNLHSAEEAMEPFLGKEMVGYLKRSALGLALNSAAATFKLNDINVPLYSRELLQAVEGMINHERGKPADKQCSFLVGTDPDKIAKLIEDSCQAYHYSQVRNVRIENGPLDAQALGNLAIDDDPIAEARQHIRSADTDGASQVVKNTIATIHAHVKSAHEAAFSAARAMNEHVQQMEDDRQEEAARSAAAAPIPKVPSLSQYEPDMPAGGGASREGHLLNIISALAEQLNARST